MKNLEKTITCTLSSQGHDVFVGAIFLKVHAEVALVVRHPLSMKIMLKDNLESIVGQVVPHFFSHPTFFFGPQEIGNRP